MGKRAVRVIVVPKGVSVALLVLTTAGMLALIYLLSGHAYARETHSTRDLLTTLMTDEERGTLSRNAFLAGLMPVAANVLLFVPWGFFMFVALDRPSRSRAATYAITLLAGLVFAFGVEAWQAMLPTRVTTTSDAIANAAGALAGAMLGHMRKNVRVKFDF